MNSPRAHPQRFSDYAHLEKEALLQAFHIDAHGYSDQEVAHSRAQYGSNTIHKSSHDTIFYRLQRAFINPFTVILFVLAAISFVTDVLLPSDFSRDMTTVLLILSMLVISGVIRFIQEMRAKRIADHLTQLFHTSVMVRRNGDWTDLPASELVVGDTVRLAAGDRVPADMRLTGTSDFFVSQAIITGESAVLEKNAAPLPPQPSHHYSAYSNIAFMGSTVIGGSGEGIVIAVGRDTVYGGFSNNRHERPNTFDHGANAIAWVLIRFMAVLAPIVFLASGLTKGEWLPALLFALSVAVGLTPEMLPMVINACLAKGSASMRRKQTIVKNINAMQGFGSMDVLCVDKTGTLTGDTILLEYYMDVLGNESDQVLDMAYLNSLYHTGIANHLDAAILKCQEMPGRRTHFTALTAAHPKVDEWPFDYDTKTASVLVQDADSHLLIVKGSIDTVCARCDYVAYKGQRYEMNGDHTASVRAVVDDMYEDGMKVLAVACKSLLPDQQPVANESALTLLGYLAFFDAPKETAAAAIEKLQAHHVAVRVLTGDQKSVALSICRRLGIDTQHVLTGAELDRLSDDRRAVRVEQTTVFAELSPKQKASIVQTLQENGHTVGFLGDGLNDLPAINAAHVGISVDNAAEAVQESADVLLLRKDLNVLEAGIVEGRQAFANMSKYIRITASSNLGNILAIVVASVCLPFFPMTSVQLLLLNLLYDTLCLVLPWDRVDEEVLARPLEWSGRTLSRFMRVFGPVSSLFDLCTFAFLFFIFCPVVCGGSFFSLAEPSAQVQFVALFQTGWFLESMWTQVLILQLLRTKKMPLLQSRPSAAVMAVTMLGILCFTILTFTPLGALIGLTAMPASYFLFLIVIVLVYLLLVTFVKKCYIKKYHELF